MKAILLVIAVALAGAGCGQGSQSGTPSDTITPAGDAVTGVYLKHDSGSPGKDTPVAGAIIGVYPRAISTSGPIMADPPSPIARVTTSPDGTFTVHVQGRQRVFLAPIGAQPLTSGKWAQVGGPSVTLQGCSDCVRPL